MRGETTPSHFLILVSLSHPPSPLFPEVSYTREFCARGCGQSPHSACTMPAQSTPARPINDGRAATSPHHELSLGAVVLSGAVQHPLTPASSPSSHEPAKCWPGLHNQHPIPERPPHPATGRAFTRFRRRVQNQGLGFR